MIVFTGIIALMAIAQFFVFKWQWDAMRAQLNEMKTTSQQLDKLVEQATQNAVAAQRSADAAKINAEALMAGERAWLLVDGVRAQGDFARQGTPRFTYTVANYGKTPGFMISAKAYVQMAPGIDAIDDTEFMEQAGSICEDAVATPKGEQLLFYGNDLSMGERQLHLSMVSNDERAMLFASDHSGPSTYLWAVGSIHYRDVFGNVRHTPFAYWYNVADAQFVRVRWPGLNKPT